MRWRYRIGVIPLADPEIPAWLLQLIMVSPTASAILACGFIVRAAIDRQAPAFTGAIKMLATAIQNATVDMQDALMDSQPRAEPPPRPRTDRRRQAGRTGSNAALPPDQSRTG